MPVSPVVKSQIKTIHDQMMSFVGPAKHVGAASADISKTLDVLDKQFEVYIAALCSLANCGLEGFNPTKSEARRLLQVAEEMKGALKLHEKSVAFFRNFSQKTNKFVGEEKQKVKELQNKFNHEDKKNNKNPVVEKEFYDAEYEFILGEQSKRYKFFADKHTEWLSQYKDLLEYLNTIDSRRKNTEPAPVQMVVVPQREEEDHHEEETQEERKATKSGKKSALWEDDVYEIPRRAKSQWDDDCEETRDHDGKRRFRNVFGTLFPTFSEELRQAARRRNNRSMTSGSSGSVEGIASRTQTVLEETGIKLLQKHKRQSESAGSHTRMESIEVRETVEHEAPRVAMLPRKDSEKVETPIMVHERDETVYKYEVNEEVPLPLPKRTTSKSSLSSAFSGKSKGNKNGLPPYVPRNLKNRDVSSSAEMQNGWPVVGKRAPAADERMVVDMDDIPPGVPRDNGVHVAEQPKPRTIPPPARPSVNVAPDIPPMYAASDYGRQLCVIEDTNSRGPTMLTVNNSDRVQLIKSGNKGWIFVKDINSERTGWIPQEATRPDWYR